MENKNKIAIVTGGNKGIGKAISKQLMADGYKVIIIARSASAEDADDFYQSDIGDTEKIEEIIKDIFNKYGKIDVLVNNAGITKDNLMLKMSLDDFYQVININLISAFHLSKLVSRHMLKARQGKIINISSISGLRGNIGQANYAASKAGLIGLTKSMAKEFASRGILVNAIAPGFIETDMTAVLSDQIKEHSLQQIPLGRFGKPEDIASAVSFLASDQANYITGQVISICGGLSI